MTALIAIQFAEGSIRGVRCMGSTIIRPLTPSSMGRSSFDHPHNLGPLLLTHYNGTVPAFSITSQGQINVLRIRRRDSTFDTEVTGGRSDQIQRYNSLQDLLQSQSDTDPDWDWLYLYCCNHKQWYFCHHQSVILFALTPDTIVDGPYRRKEGAPW